MFFRCSKYIGQSDFSQEDKLEEHLFEFSKQSLVGVPNLAAPKQFFHWVAIQGAIS